MRTRSEPMPALLNRQQERAALDDLLGAVRAGRGRALVVRGEAGVGKSALLEYVVGAAADMRVARAVGVESEMEHRWAPGDLAREGSPDRGTRSMNGRVWLHAAGFDTAPHVWPELVLARIKAGPSRSPWTAMGALSISGERIMLGGVGRGPGSMPARAGSPPTSPRREPGLSCR